MSDVICTRLARIEAVIIDIVDHCLCEEGQGESERWEEREMGGEGEEGEEGEGGSDLHCYCLQWHSTCGRGNRVQVVSEATEYKISRHGNNKLPHHPVSRLGCPHRESILLVHISQCVCVCVHV